MSLGPFWSVKSYNICRSVGVYFLAILITVCWLYDLAGSKFAFLRMRKPHCKYNTVNHTFSQYAIVSLCEFQPWRGKFDFFLSFFFSLFCVESLSLACSSIVEVSFSPIEGDNFKVRYSWVMSRLSIYFFVALLFVQIIDRLFIMVTDDFLKLTTLSFVHLIVFEQLISIESHGINNL